jgi:pyrimidine-nucleoside phosphorylase
VAFNITQLIKNKRLGRAHSQAEIKFLIDGFTASRVADYQMAAWAMAVCFNGLSSDETAWLTAAMRDSGRTLNFGRLKNQGRPRIDKHSTGGVGDKTSLIIGPILAACEIHTPMIAGRGLGHTGGTLDKLESIPGFRVFLSEEEFTQNVEKHFFSIMGQTESICPADRKFYALRDVTGTVDSLPLICGSIMSKKLAEDLSGLVLDVKFGSGAFMKTVDEAQELATLLKSTGESNGLRVHALLTNMDQPLGRFAGNAPEVIECIDILRGGTVIAQDTRDLSIELSAHAILLADRAPDLSAARDMAERALASGAAWRAFQKLLSYQGNGQELNLDSLRAQFEHVVLAPASGHIVAMNTEQIGYALVELGVGRKKASDSVDLFAGVEFFAKTGSSIEKGQPLFRLMGSSQPAFEDVSRLLCQSVQISNQAFGQKPLPLIAKVLT